ncbi:MAG: 4Fe-4S binding protein [Candidatus Heimdallarchaeota archaeon]|nr:4Fe-4S binding protein [Candidatus Heimdallarchaeota archaeon]
MIEANETNEKTPRLENKVTHPKRNLARRILIFISFMLFPITIFYLSPYLSIMGPVMGFISACLIIFGTLFISSLFLGRIFCSYFCPMAGMQEAMAKIRNKRINKKSFFVKWIIFIPWILVIILLPILFGEPFQGVDFFFGMDNQEIGIPGISILSVQGIIIYYIIITILLVMGFAIGKRSFCHHLCWVGPFMVIGRKLSNWLRIPSLRLQANNKKCIQCKRCDRVCLMSLDVHEMVRKGNMENSNCILCGECIDECPKNVIQYKFKSYKKAITEEIPNN